MIEGTPASASRLPRNAMASGPPGASRSFNSTAVHSARGSEAARLTATISAVETITGAMPPERPAWVGAVLMNSSESAAPPCCNTLQSGQTSTLATPNVTNSVARCTACSRRRAL